ncbi:leukocyte immunoglobulin-like receptor subfamily A member 2 [Macrotis lagotis]|uniref:leukocyte immunoglobulin-like receptor subfamily A member 2 n=1 Tax=Macrotis lagotis TaxID=92651 RepID=UPI003D68774C
MTSVFTMTATLSVLLCLGLCLGQRMRTQAGRPYLSASKGPLVPLGSSVTLRCGGSQWAKSYLLEKEQESGTIKIIKEKPARGEVEFLIPSVKAKRAGKYYCCSRHSSVLSECSNPLELVVTGEGSPQPQAPQTGLAQCPNLSRPRSGSASGRGNQSLCIAFCVPSTFHYYPI